jgi:phosphoglycerate dehydrogenase-like enzyme
MSAAWGIIGAGKISSDFANALRATGATVVAVAATDLGRAQQVYSLACDARARGALTF